MSGQWEVEALCREIGGNVWFPDSETDAGYGPAIAYCQTCPVIEQCLASTLRRELGVRANSRHGVFGGLTPYERGALQMPLEHGTRSCYINDLCRCQACTAAYKAPKAALAA